MLYFHQLAPVDGQCQCKKEMKQRRKWLDLLNHMKTKQPDCDKDDGRQQRIANYLSLAKEANCVFGWLQWITQTVRFYRVSFHGQVFQPEPDVNSDPEEVHALVTKKEEIARSLPEKSIWLDGWTRNSTHHVQVYASLSSTDANSFQTC